MYQAPRFHPRATRAAAVAVIPLASLLWLSETRAQGHDPAGNANAEAARPNVVFFVVDDQSHDALGMMDRYPFLETPNMDRLAEEGAKFDNAFVTTSLCSPSRATFLSGQYAHRHGVRYNDGKDLPDDAPNFAQRLRENGYETAFIGKWHQGPTDDPRRGFDHWVSFRGQGQYFDQEIDVNGQQVQTEGYNTDMLTGYAERYLRQPKDEPFAMCLWYKAVHAPFSPAPRHEDAFADAELPEPASFTDTFEGKPRWIRRGNAYGGWLKKDWEASEGKPVPDRITPRDWDQMGKKRWMDQLRALLAVDDSLGRVMKTLDELGELDNTIIVFTSDNGYFFGEHRRWDKRLAYEESMQIPMLVRYPRSIEPGTRVDEMVLSNDIPVTLLDFAGVEPDPRMQGASFRPLIDRRHEGESAQWRDAFLYEYFQEPWWLPGVPTINAVRTERWKLITYPEDDQQIDELYDLKNDPVELNNLAQDPAYADRVASLRKRLEQLKREADYTAPSRPGGVQEAPLASVLHWDFSRSGSGRVTDSTGNGHHGRVGVAEAQPGRAGTAVKFNGRGAVRLDNPPGP